MLKAVEGIDALHFERDGTWRCLESFNAWPKEMKMMLMRIKSETNMKLSRAVVHHGERGCEEPGGCSVGGIDALSPERKR